MDKSKFTNQMTSELMPIVQPFADYAFIPDHLPNDWVFPNSLWPLLAEAKESLGTLNGIGRTLPDPELLMRPLQYQEMLRSSSLEGTYATLQEVLWYDEDSDEPTSEHDPVNARREVSNYAVALREGISMLAHRPLSIVMIRAMHDKLLRGVRGKDQSPGDFRRQQVHIGFDRRFVPPPPHLVNDLMDNLQTYMNMPNHHDALVRCFVAHYQFEAIHPFLDGNGRVGRALLSLMIAATHDHSRPWLYLSAYFDRHKDEYIQRMFDVSSTGQWEAWIRFCLQGVVAQANDSCRRCEALLEVQLDFQQKIDAAKPRVAQIVNELFSKPSLTIPRMRDTMQVSYKTAQKDIAYLVGLGILQPMSETSRPQIFYAPAIVHIATADSIE